MTTVTKRNKWEVWRDVIFALFIREIRTGFNDKIGISWSVIQPVAFIFVLAYVRGRINGGETHSIPTFTFMAIGLVLILGFLSIIIYLVIRIILRNKKLAVLNDSLIVANTEIKESHEEIYQQSAQLSKANTLLEERHKDILTHKEEIHQLKLRFFTNISHEFRTPLSLITAPIEELSKNTNLDKKQKYLLHCQPIK